MYPLCVWEWLPVWEPFYWRRVQKENVLHCQTVKFMIHQPMGGASGQATDIAIHAEHILRTRETLNKILAERTGQSLEKIKQDTERDNFMTAEQAKAYGLVDEVMSKH